MTRHISSPDRARFATVVLVLTFVAAACSGDGSTAGTTTSFTSLHDDSTSTLADHAGTPLVVNFFAATCPPCRGEMPDFQEVSQDLGDRVRFIGISVDPTRAEADEVVADTGVTYDLGWDPDFALYYQFGGFKLPTTVFLSADGETLEVVSNALSESTLRDLIDEHLL